jgi:hypothetical protein
LGVVQQIWIFTAIKLGKSQARFPFKQGKSRLGSWMEKISTTEDTENTEVLVRNL